MRTGGGACRGKLRLIVRLPADSEDRMLPAVSTLAEIEAAVPSLNLEELERLEVQGRLLRRQRAEGQQKSTDLMEHAGILRLTEDPLKWQGRMREEWE